MASTGPALFPSTSTFPGTTVFPGQDTLPIVRCRVSFDDVTVSPPTWTEQTLAGSPNRIRSYSVSRGRPSELDGFDAGTATVVFDNRDRSLDPAVNASVRPLNRVWLYEEFSGEVHDLFRGYAESWTQGWDASGIVDATATVQAADEFKVLSLINLPATDPPRDTYAEVVAFDGPTGYWPLYAPAGGNGPEFQGNPGQPLVSFQGGAAWATGAQGAIVGETLSDAGFATTGDIGGGNIAYGPSQTFSENDPLDPSGLSEVTIELWVRAASVPGTSNEFVQGSFDGTRRSFTLDWTGSQFRFVARNSVGGAATATGGTAVPNQWHHLVGTISGGNARLYVDGVQVASTAWTPPFSSVPTTGGYLGNSANPWDADEMVYYRFGISAARIAAHYTAGRQRGFNRSDASHARIGYALDAVSSTAPRSFPFAGARNVEGEFYKTQPPLDVIRHALEGENVDAAFFTKADGTLLFLADGHRSSSPYNTVQATFGDGGGAELPYLDFAMDYSESFLFNEFNVTGVGGSLATTSDATSIGKYFKRSRSVSAELLLASNAPGVATALLAKYKDPMQRVTMIKPKMADAETCRVTFARELMDRIRVLRTPPGGGARVDQTLFIQKIDILGAPGLPPDVTLGVSPL